MSGKRKDDHDETGQPVAKFRKIDDLSSGENEENDEPVSESTTHDSQTRNGNSNSNNRDDCNPSSEEDALAEGNGDVVEVTNDDEDDEEEEEEDDDSEDSEDDDEEMDPLKLSISSDEEESVKFVSIPMTPFHMKEEMKEGRFDEDGTFIWNKGEVVKDNWLDNINWAAVKKAEQNKPGGVHNIDYTIGSPESADPYFVYRKLLEYLNPGESINMALRRLGKMKGLSALEKLKMKKAGEPIIEDREGCRKIIELTEYAHQLLSKTGNLDIYDENYEYFLGQIKDKKYKAPELDMYADDFAEKEKAKLVLPDSTQSTSDLKITLRRQPRKKVETVVHSGEGDGEDSSQLEPAEYTLVLKPKTVTSESDQIGLIAAAPTSTPTSSSENERSGSSPKLRASDVYTDSDSSSNDSSPPTSEEERLASTSSSSA